MTPLELVARAGWLLRLHTREAWRRRFPPGVDWSRRFVFIHVPKTAGTSIGEALGLRGTTHATARELKALLGARYDQLFSFAFVRHPWDRFVSLYHYARQAESHHHSATAPWRSRYGKHPDHDILKEASLHEAAQLLATGQLSVQWRPQHEWLHDAQGRCLVHFVGRMEQIARDWQSVAARIGVAGHLPEANRSAPTREAVTVHPETRALVERHYEHDFVWLGYAR